MSEITILPYQELGGFVGQSEGHGIFVDCGGYRMNVGAILPQSDGKYLLNVLIMAEMQVAGYRLCDFTDFYETVEGAADAARTFLASKRNEGQ